MSCPPECHENIQALYRMSWPGWTRAILISLLGCIFVFAAWVYDSGVKTYATKEDVKEIKVELKQDMKEVKEMLSQLISRRNP